jgi:hypothetical protein
MSATLPQPPGTVATFAQILSSTRRGARLARLLPATQLLSWDLSPDVTERAEQIVAELPPTRSCTPASRAETSGSP